MIPDGFSYRHQKPDYNWTLAGVAIAFSIILHILFIFFCGDWNLTGLTRVVEKSRDWLMPDKVPPMRVETLSADPMRIMDKVPGERDTPSRGPIEVSERVEALSRESSPALTAPPPIPREALSPGVPALSETSAKKIDTTPWMPRQEIKQIFDRTVQDDVATLPRREIPMIERVPDAPDITASIDLAGRKFGKQIDPPKPLKAAEVFDTEIVQGTFAQPAVAVPKTPDKTSSAATKNKFADKPGDKRVSSEKSADKQSGRGDKSGDERVASGDKSGDERVASGDKSGDKRVVSGDKSGDKRISGDVGKPGDEQVSGDTAKPGIIKKKPGAKDSPSIPISVPETVEEKLTRKAREKIESIEEKVEYKSIDNLLAIGLETYRDPEEPGRLYFRIGIQPRTDKPVPVVAKDIIWVQDVSGSVTEDRLSFCRKALITAMSSMNPQDRFNVIGFRDTFESCFPGWTPVTVETQKKAVDFISSMRAFGKTDVFGSLRSLLRYERDPMRPMIAFVITDGIPTVGLTGSSKIIGSFSDLNSGLMSVYMYGTHAKANNYLLDMLTYCNRGKALVMDGSRWEITRSMETFFNGIRNPILGDISVTFNADSNSEVYPLNTSNLYKDQQLELIGVCPEGTGNLVLQVRGLAAGKGYDSIFRLNLKEHAKAGSPLLKVHWARQKMFHLVGEYSITPHQQTFAEMLKINKKHNIEIPYKLDLK